MAGLKRALLFVNSHKAAAPALADAIGRELTRLGVGVVSYPFEGQFDLAAAGEFDLAFSLGGDGTVLYAARTIAPYGVPIFPINIGTLGFIAVVPPEEWLPVFEQWRRGEAGLSRRLMLELTVERRGEVVARFSCLNDAVISASGIAKIIRLQVSSDASRPLDAGRPLDASRPMEYMRLGHYRSDGLIVATPTGSTAYSVAAGGPILDPEIEAVIINPICPFTLSNRPIVVPAHETVMVEVEAEQRSGVLLTVDGQTTEALEPKDQIFIRRAPYKAQLIASDRRAFYKALRTKLNWSGSSGGADHA